jgi:hypothetical protein
MCLRLVCFSGSLIFVDVTPTLWVVLHPYYKLNYIKMAWGGEAEQADEIAAGNLDAKNWYREVELIIEATVYGQLSVFIPLISISDANVPLRCCGQSVRHAHPP